MSRAFLAEWGAVPASAVLAALLWWGVSDWMGAQAGVAPAFVAAASCWTGVIAAKVLGLLAERRGVNPVLIQATLGLLVRMAFPMMVCMMASLQGGSLSDGGVVYAVLVVYPVTLIVETFVQLSFRSPTTA